MQAAIRLNRERTKTEIRNPKSERSPKSEARKPKATDRLVPSFQTRGQGGPPAGPRPPDAARTALPTRTTSPLTNALRISDFGILSGFGFRASDSIPSNATKSREESRITAFAGGATALKSCSARSQLRKPQRWRRASETELQPRAQRAGRFPGRSPPLSLARERSPSCSAE